MGGHAPPAFVRRSHFECYEKVLQDGVLCACCLNILPSGKRGQRQCDGKSELGKCFLMNHPRHAELTQRENIQEKTFKFCSECYGVLDKFASLKRKTGATFNYLGESPLENVRHGVRFYDLELRSAGKEWKECSQVACLCCSRQLASSSSLRVHQRVGRCKDGCSKCEANKQQYKNLRESNSEHNPSGKTTTSESSDKRINSSTECDKSDQDTAKIKIPPGDRSSNQNNESNQTIRADKGITKDNHTNGDSSKRTNKESIQSKQDEKNAIGDNSCNQKCDSNGSNKVKICDDNDKNNQNSISTRSVEAEQSYKNEIIQSKPREVDPSISADKQNHTDKTIPEGICRNDNNESNQHNKSVKDNNTNKLSSEDRCATLNHECNKANKYEKCQSEEKTKISGSSGNQNNSFKSSIKAGQECSNKPPNVTKKSNNLDFFPSFIGEKDELYKKILRDNESNDKSTQPKGNSKEETSPAQNRDSNKVNGTGKEQVKKTNQITKHYVSFDRNQNLSNNACNKNEHDNKSERKNYSKLDSENIRTNQFEGEIGNGSENKFFKRDRVEKFKNKIKERKEQTILKRKSIIPLRYPNSWFPPIKMPWNITIQSDTLLCAKTSLKASENLSITETREEINRERPSSTVRDNLACIYLKEISNPLNVKIQCFHIRKSNCDGANNSGVKSRDTNSSINIHILRDVEHNSNISNKVDFAKINNSQDKTSTGINQAEDSIKNKNILSDISREKDTHETDRPTLTDKQNNIDQTLSDEGKKTNDELSLSKKGNSKVETLLNTHNNESNKDDETNKEPLSVIDNNTNKLSSEDRCGALNHERNKANKYEKCQSKEENKISGSSGNQNNFFKSSIKAGQECSNKLPDDTRKSNNLDSIPSFICEKDELYKKTLRDDEIKEINDESSQPKKGNSKEETSPAQNMDSNKFNGMGEEQVKKTNQMTKDYVSFDRYLFFTNNTCYKNDHDKEIERKNDSKLDSENIRTNQFEGEIGKGGENKFEKRDRLEKFKNKIKERKEQTMLKRKSIIPLRYPNSWFPPIKMPWNIIIQRDTLLSAKTSLKASENLSITKTREEINRERPSSTVRDNLACINLKEINNPLNMKIQCFNSRKSNCDGANNSGVESRDTNSSIIQILRDVEHNSNISNKVDFAKINNKNSQDNASTGFNQAEDSIRNKNIFSGISREKDTHETDRLTLTDKQNNINQTLSDGSCKNQNNESIKCNQNTKYNTEDKLSPDGRFMSLSHECNETNKSKKNLSKEENKVGDGSSNKNHAFNLSYQAGQECGNKLFNVRQNLDLTQSFMDEKVDLSLKILREDKGKKTNDELSLSKKGNSKVETSLYTHNNESNKDNETIKEPIEKIFEIYKECANFDKNLNKNNVSNKDHLEKGRKGPNEVPRGIINDKNYKLTESIQAEDSKNNKIISSENPVEKDTREFYRTTCFCLSANKQNNTDKIQSDDSCSNSNNESNQHKQTTKDNKVDKISHENRCSNFNQRCNEANQSEKYHSNDENKIGSCSRNQYTAFNPLNQSEQEWGNKLPNESRKSENQEFNQSDRCEKDKLCMNKQPNDEGKKTKYKLSHHKIGNIKEYSMPNFRNNINYRDLYVDNNKDIEPMDKTTKNCKDDEHFDSNRNHCNNATNKDHLRKGTIEKSLNLDDEGIKKNQFQVSDEVDIGNKKDKNDQNRKLSGSISAAVIKKNKIILGDHPRGKNTSSSYKSNSKTLIHQSGDPMTIYNEKFENILQTDEIGILSSTFKTKNNAKNTIENINKTVCNDNETNYNESDVATITDSQLERNLEGIVGHSPLPSAAVLRQECSDASMVLNILDEHRGLGDKNQTDNQCGQAISSAVDRSSAKKRRRNSSQSSEGSIKKPYCSRNTDNGSMQESDGSEEDYNFVLRLESEDSQASSIHIPKDSMAEQSVAPNVISDNPEVVPELNKVDSALTEKTENMNRVEGFKEDIIILSSGDEDSRETVVYDPIIDLDNSTDEIFNNQDKEKTVKNDTILENQTNESDQQKMQVSIKTEVVDDLCNTQERGPKFPLPIKIEPFSDRPEKSSAKILKRSERSKSCGTNQSRIKVRRLSDLVSSEPDEFSKCLPRHLLSLRQSSQDLSLGPPTPQQHQQLSPHAPHSLQQHLQTSTESSTHSQLPSPHMQLPSQYRQLPSQQPQLWTQHAKPPSQNLQMPSQHLQLPLRYQPLQRSPQNVQRLSQNPRHPQHSLQNVQMPLQKVQMPLQNVKMPLQNVQIPLQNVQIPLQNVQMPLQNVQIPLQNVQIPSQHLQQPLRHPPQLPLLLTRCLQRSSQHLNIPSHIPPHSQLQNRLTPQQRPLSPQQRRLSQNTQENSVRNPSRTALPSGSIRPHMRESDDRRQSLARNSFQSRPPNRRSSVDKFDSTMHYRNRSPETIATTSRASVFASQSVASASRTSGNRSDVVNVAGNLPNTHSHNNSSNQSPYYRPPPNDPPNPEGNTSQSSDGSLKALLDFFRLQNNR